VYADVGGFEAPRNELDAIVHRQPTPHRWFSPAPTCRSPPIGCTARRRAVAWRGEGVIRTLQPVRSPKAAPKHLSEMATTAAPPISLPSTQTTQPGTPRAVVWAATFTGIGALAMAGSGTGYRLHLWSLDWAFYVLAAGAALATAGGIWAAISLARADVRRRPRALPIAAATLVAAAIASGTFISWLLTARDVPGIHDITTDTDDPPAFEALRAARVAAPNGLDYGGHDVAVKQHAAYPDIVPIVLPIAPIDAFRRALMVAHSLGWEIAAADSGSGRIEATATTPWFGFRDDVAIRVRAAGNGSRVDVRSDSRLGGSDVGTNAARIRRFVSRLRG
jgi:uncharacterized protein (DUF1499 family)